MSRPSRLGLTVLAWAAFMAIAAGCASTHRQSSAQVSSGTTAAVPTTAASAPASPSTTAPQQVPTVPNCGGGAYKPQTLLIVCGSGTTMATGVSWRSWEQALASGTGTVHLQVNGQSVSGPATLQLSQVVHGPVGPQYTLLTVTWTGTPPDGKASEIYHLQVQG
jgi:hypothetical protein